MHVLTAPLLANTAHDKNSKGTLWKETSNRLEFFLKDGGVFDGFSVWVFQICKRDQLRLTLSVQVGNMKLQKQQLSGGVVVFGVQWE